MRLGSRVPLPVRAILRGRNNATYYRLLREGRITVGRGTYGLPPEIRTYPHDATRLVIGSFCSIAGGTTFVLGGQHAVDRVTTYPIRIMYDLPGKGADGFPIPRGDIVLGSDVWIGHGVTVLGGVHVGHGAIIGAGAVVVKDIPPFAVAGGNPAAVRRFRFAEDQRAALLRIAWWEWPDAAIVAAVDRLSGADIDGFISWAEAAHPLRQP